MTGIPGPAASALDGIRKRVALAYASPARMAESGADVPRLLAAVDALSAALRLHTFPFTDGKGAVLCGGCLRQAPCPYSPEAIITTALAGKEAGDEH